MSPKSIIDSGYLPFAPQRDSYHLTIKKKCYSKNEVANYFLVTNLPFLGKVKWWTTFSSLYVILLLLILFSMVSGYAIGLRLHW